VKHGRTDDGPRLGLQMQCGNPATWAALGVGSMRASGLLRKPAGLCAISALRTDSAEDVHVGWAQNAARARRARAGQSVGARYVSS